jgi:hypothetical protein
MSKSRVGAMPFHVLGKARLALVLEDGYRVCRDPSTQVAWDGTRIVQADSS